MQHMRHPARPGRCAGLPCFLTRLASGLALTLAVAVLTGCVTNMQLRERGEEALARGDAPAAREAYGQAVDRRPSDWMAQEGLGRAYLALDQPLEAQLAFEKAHVARYDDPDFTPRIVDGIAEALYRQERDQELHAFLEDTANYYATTRAYLRQAEYLVKLGDADAAVVAYQKAAYFADDDDARPYVELADYYQSINDQPNALRSLRYAYYVDPDYPGLADRFRAFGVVPGPTLADEPPKPDLLTD